MRALGIRYTSSGIDLGTPPTPAIKNKTKNRTSLTTLFIFFFFKVLFIHFERAHV